MTKIKVGDWRTEESGPMQVVSGPLGRERVHYEAPKAPPLASETKAFIDWLDSKQELDPVLKAAIAHLWFVTIHPFEDGNGRIARAIAGMAWARSENSSQRFCNLRPLRIRIACRAICPPRVIASNNPTASEARAGLTTN
jgi:Fic family protein